MNAGALVQAKGVAVHKSVTLRTGHFRHAIWSRPLLMLAVLVFGALLSAEAADARLAARTRLAGESSMGLSRLALLERREDEVSPHTAQPSYPAGSLGGLFSRPGLVGGLAAGFLGAGVFGVLFGHGFIGELSGYVSILGLLVQLALLLLLGRLIWTWWRLDKAAAKATLSPRQLADAYRSTRIEVFDADAETDIGEKKIFAPKEHSG